MVTTGFNGGKQKTSEIVDLTVKGGNMCKNWPEFPVRLDGATGGLVKDTVIICGGFNGTFSHVDEWITNECYSLTSEKATLVTHMSFRRASAASIVFNDNALWVTGGFNHNIGVLNSTEYVTMTKTMPGPDLPMALEAHAMVPINSTYSMVIGGGHGEEANYCLFQLRTFKNSEYFFTLFRKTKSFICFYVPYFLI